MTTVESNVLVPSFSSLKVLGDLKHQCYVVMKLWMSETLHLRQRDPNLLILFLPCRYAFFSQDQCFSGLNVVKLHRRECLFSLFNMSELFQSFLYHQDLRVCKQAA